MTCWCWFSERHVNSCAVLSKVKLARGTRCYRCLQKQFPYVDFHVFFSLLYVARNLWLAELGEHKSAPQYFTPLRYLCVVASFADNEFFSLDAFIFSFFRLPLAAFSHEILFSKSKWYAKRWALGMPWVRVTKIWIWIFWGAKTFRQRIKTLTVETKRKNRRFKFYLDVGRNFLTP